MAASTKAAAERQRSVLARLLEAAEPRGAERLAGEFIGEFGNLGRLLSQTPEALGRVAGPRSAAAKLIHDARDLMTEAMRSDLLGTALDPVDPVLQRYLIAAMGSLPDEALRIFFLDGSRRLIAEEQLQQGTLTHLAFYPRTLFRRAMEHNAASVLLVHNHPSGDATPSLEDIRVTDLLDRIGRTLDIAILDHIVVSARETYHIVRGEAVGRQMEEQRACTLADVAGSHTEPGASAVENARRSARRRMLRRQLIGAEELFGEPAWDMLIDIFIHDAGGKPLSTSCLCVGSDASVSTAFRLVQRLCRAGLVVRESDPEDGRRNFVRLSPETMETMKAYFAGISK